MPYCFDHFDRDNLVILARKVAIVAQKNFNLLIEFRFINSFLSKLILLVRNGDPSHPATIGSGCVYGKTSPTTANFKDVIIFIQIQFSAKSI